MRSLTISVGETGRTLHGNTGVSDPRDVGPVAALLNLVDSLFVAIIVGLSAIIGTLRWIWNVRSGDLERMIKTESEVALAGET